MSEFKPTSKPSLKERLSKLWRFIKLLAGWAWKGIVALFKNTLFFVLTVICRVFIISVILLGAIVICLFLLFRGTNETGEIMEEVGFSMKHRKNI